MLREEGRVEKIAGAEIEYSCILVNCAETNSKVSQMNSSVEKGRNQIEFPIRMFILREIHFQLFKVYSDVTDSQIIQWIG